MQGRLVRIHGGRVAVVGLPPEGNSQKAWYAVAGILAAIILAIVLFFVLLAFATLMIRSDRAIAIVGRVVGWIANRFHLGDGASLGDRVVESRDVVRDALRDSWRRAVPAAAANQMLDSSRR